MVNQVRGLRCYWSGFLAKPSSTHLHGTEKCRCEVNWTTSHNKYRLSRGKLQAGEYKAEGSRLKLTSILCCAASALFAPVTAKTMNIIIFYMIKAYLALRAMCTLWSQLEHIPPIPELPDRRIKLPDYDRIRATHPSILKHRPAPI